MTVVILEDAVGDIELGDRWFDDDDPLTDEQKALLDARLADMEQNPNASIP